MQAVGHPQRKQPVALGTVHAEALQLTVVVEEAEPVTIGESCRPSYGEHVTANLLHPSHIFAHSFRCVERGDVTLSPVQEIAGEASVESLLQVGRKEIGGTPERGTAIAVWMTGDNLVQPLAVSRHDVLHIAHILQPSFNLERAGSCLDEFFKIVYAAHVTERKQVALVLYDVAFTILQVEPQAAELCAGTSVGAASETILRGIADAGIAYAEGSVDEDLQFHIGHLAMNLGYLTNG